ncbi:amino acid adenylation domain-containing protein [Streptomyces sp. URMC 123]|uniref:amino acid adenylation domain-containing protein n=1 Tax=Streptomyces sp. URMC 123 TaxID=3423403 RepID=UPI003F1DB136
MSVIPRYPLTAYQRDIWAAASLLADAPQFNCVLHERLEGTVDHDLLAASVERALLRGDAFRLRFDEEDGTPWQWVSESAPEVRRVDLTSAADPAAACAQWLEEELRRPVPLRDSAMVEPTLLVESPTVVHLHVKAHHLVLDGWTVNELGHQIFEDYARALRGEDPLPVEGAPAYRDFVAEEAAYRASAAHESDRAAVREALLGATPTLFQRKAPSGARRTARYTFTLDGGLMERVRAAGHSPFAYVATLFGGYLARVHRSDDVLIGVPLLNRAHWREGVMGQFANMLPLRVAAGDERPLAEAVADTRSAVRLLQRHQRLALGDALRDLARAGGAGAPRQLFDVTLSYMRHARPEPLPGVERRTAMFAPAHDQDVLSVHICDFDDAPDLRVELMYAEDVFDEDFPIASLAGHLTTLIEKGLESGDRPLSAVPVLTEAERADLTRGRARGPVVPYADRATVHGLFEAQAARRPQQTALVDGATGQSLSYAELDARANRVARALRAEGVGPDDRVAVLMERGPALLVALLGVLKAGGAYVPVDPGYPAERIRFLLSDSRAKVVLVDDALPQGLTTGPAAEGAGPAAEAPATATGAAEAGGATGAGAPAIAAAVRPLSDLLAAQPSGAPLEPLATSRDLAYVIYTSGSTGRPKGVMVEHHSVVNRLAWMQRAYPIAEGDTLLQKTPVSFDVSVWELFWWAVEGARLALLPPGGEKDPEVILRTIQERQVGVVHFVPSMLGPFLDLLEDSPELVAATRSLRTVFCSGEALPPARVEQFNRLLGGGPAPAPRLVNLYGPTEATVDVSYHDCPDGSAGPVRRVPIGRPIDNTQLYVLGAHDEPQPVGVPGELCVGGVQVARGYLERPELTREKFVDDPFTPGGRLYRTGDLARWLADGSIEYLGRIDGQVKIRGNRVETGEVSAALCTAPGVRDAIVVDRVTEDRGTHLVGYYVAAAEVPAATLRAHLRERLPEFMVPALFHRIDRVPLTPNGKADRRALPEPGSAPSPAGRQEPRTEAEAVLAGIWATVLKVERVGVHDDYYALGGDSILMLRIRAEAARHGLHFSLGDLVRNPTVAALAALADTGPREGAGGELRPFALVSSVDRARLEGVAEDAYPLTRLQLGLLYHSRRDERSAVYKDVFRYSLELPWDEAAFRAAHERLVARHPVLRSSFDLAHHSEPLQIVRPRVVGGLDIADLRSWGAAEAEAEILRHVEERRYHPYVFDRAPLHLLRAHVLPDGVELVLSFHHAILDGGSVANLLRELLQDYAHRLGLGIGPVAEDTLPSPAHHVLAERRALESADTRRHWRELLAGADPLRVEGWRPHEAPAGAEQIVRRVELPEELAAGVRRLAHEHALPVKSVLLAAHCLTLRLLTGREDVVTGVVTHGRPEREGAERIAGLFLNTVPVRLDTAAESWLAVAREAFRQEREGHAHRLYPLSAIQEDHGSAVFETAFNYVHFRQLAEVLDLPGVRLRSFRTWEETNFALLVNAVTDPAGDRLGLRIDCDGRVFGAGQADLLAESYLAVLRRMVERPGEEVDFAFLAPAPARPAAVVPAPRGVVASFLEQAARTPAATALAMGDQRWSYERLAAASGAVARRLADLGTPAGARIGIAMDRSPETVAAIVGTLRAGAAVVPLDTGYPPERLAAMIERSAPYRVIAHERHAHLVTDRELVLSAESLAAADAGGTDAGDLPLPNPESTAYVLFTSGSTGTPKGVAMPHRSLANLVAWQNRIPSGAVGGTTLQYAPLSFDVSFQEIFSTLCSGGTLLLIGEAERRDMPALLRLLDREGVQRVFLPYVALQQLAEAADALGIAPRALRVLISSGEQLRVTDEIRRFLAALPGALLENQYGPTESHVVTSFTMTGDPAAFPALPPIGRPIDGAEALVLDARLRPVPPGVKGEIHLGGACLAEGYEGRPDLTKERFLAHPFGADGEVLYRTGDLGLVLPGGDIVCAGRSDSQVKVRGFRVETAEVEIAITRLAGDHPGIREVAVVARRREGNDTFLAAFLVGDPEGADLDELRKRLRATLPEYMVPSHIEWLPRLPLTPSGKRDDAALRAAPLTTGATAAGATEPRDAYERVLAEILADLLQLPAVGVHDNMFDLGGTSLTAMRLVVLIEQRYGVNVPLSGFIAAPTVAELAARLRSGDAVPAFDPLVPIRPQGDRRPLFMVHPMGGNVLCYLPFARHLPADQPLYALQAAGAEPGTEPLRSVPELAASYVAALRRVQPHGPYTIGGWSFGGFVAFEVARQLREAGEEVADLVLLDTTALNPGERVRHSDDALLGWFFWELLWLERGGASPMEVIPEGLTTLEEKFSFIARFATEAGVLPAGSSGAVVRRLFRVYEANWTAALEYRPEAVPQDVTLIRATEPLPEVLLSMHGAAGSRHEDPANGWQLMTCGRLEVIGVPGDHLTIMEEPYVEYVAKTVADVIQREPAAVAPPRRADSDHAGSDHAGSRHSGPHHPGSDHHHEKK